jgi:RNA polymerase sigma-70 factor (ECF subfamily)
MSERRFESPGIRLRPAAPDEAQEGRELELARAMLREDPGAPAALWDHFAPLVRGLLARALGPHEEVEDAMQEVFMRVFHKGRALRVPALLRSYVVSVTLHHVRSQFRRRRVRRLFRAEARAEALAGEAGVVHPARQLAVSALYRALDRLPANERLAFTLRYIEGVEIAEGAAMTETSMATFKRRLAAAKDRLWRLTGEDAFLAPYLTTVDFRSVGDSDGDRSKSTGRSNPKITARTGNS